MRGMYVGDVEELVGKTAMLQPGETKATVKAQFDDQALGEQYTRGWQSYPSRDFVVEQYCCVMFEPGEQLSLSEQVNEVFGPFPSGEEVDAWAARASEVIKGRQWLVIPMSDPAVLNEIDPKVN